MASSKYHLRLDENLDQAVREVISPSRGFSESVRELLELSVRSRRHPGVYFVDNSRGEPVARIAGAKIWVLIDLYRAQRERGLKHDGAINAVVRESGVDRTDIERVLLYYADYTDEIDSKIERSRLEADRLVEQMSALHRIAA